MTQHKTHKEIRRLQRRRLLLRLLYAMDVSSSLEPSITSALLYDPLDEVEEGISESQWEDVTTSLENLWYTRKTIDARIQALSPRWRLDRMATIDRNVLRIGVWELMEQSGPAIVVINDCIELAKQFGGKNSGGFVNGLLDQLCKDLNLSMR